MLRRKGQVRYEEYRAANARLEGRRPTHDDKERPYWYLVESWQVLEPLSKLPDVQASLWWRKWDFLTGELVVILAATALFSTRAHC